MPPQTAPPAAQPTVPPTPGVQVPQPPTAAQPAPQPAPVYQPAPSASNGHSTVDAQDRVAAEQRRDNPAL